MHGCWDASRSSAPTAPGASIDLLIEDGITGPVDWQSFDGGSLIAVAGKGVLILTTLDIDELSGETVDGVTADAASRLQQALNAAAEARTPVALLRAAAVAAVVVGAGPAAPSGASRARATPSPAASSTSPSGRSPEAESAVDVVRASRLPVMERGVRRRRWAAASSSS